MMPSDPNSASWQPVLSPIAPELEQERDGSSFEEVATGLPSPEKALFRVDEESIDARTAWNVRPTLLRALYMEGPDLWVDLNQVRFIDSSGLGMLVAVHKEACEMNGKLHLVNLSREVVRILQMTGLGDFFE
jgi:anti-sigma B factor antagonist